MFVCMSVHHVKSYYLYISICILFDSNNPTFMHIYERILVMYE